ncbi:MAG: hypothetical protein ACM359_01515 [Bacillota bacterium]
MGSTQAIVKRNQLNSQLSTGPRSAGGKAIAKLNSRRHGLCANPAAGTLEDKRQFERLHRQLVLERAACRHKAIPEAFPGAGFPLMVENEPKRSGPSPRAPMLL